MGESNNNSKIADNIKKYRSKLCISQDKLSKLADDTYNTIIKIGSGANTNPIIETLQKKSRRRWGLALMTSFNKLC